MAHVYRNRATGKNEPEPRKGYAYYKITHLTEEERDEMLKNLPPAETKEQDVTAENKAAETVKKIAEPVKKRLAERRARRAKK